MDRGVRKNGPHGCIFRRQGLRPVEGRPLFGAGDQQVLGDRAVQNPRGQRDARLARALGAQGHDHRRIRGQRLGQAVGTGKEACGMHVGAHAEKQDGNRQLGFQIAGDKAERVGVTIIERNADSVLVGADLKEGDAVVIEGLQRVRPGAAVKIAGQEEDGKGKNDQAKPGQGT